MIVISYSLTGNNQALAESVAETFKAEHFQITESKKRTIGTIILDILFNRTPKINPMKDLKDYDLVLFAGPVWMGQAASPFRSCFKHLKGKLNRYAFLSISGGALGPNPKLSDELNKRLGKTPAAVIDMHIADLLPSEPKPTAKETSAYRLNEKDKKNLTATVVKKIQEAIS